MIFKVSTEKERRSIAPYHHIPSQKWCKFAKEDMFEHLIGVGFCSPPSEMKQEVIRLEAELKEMDERLEEVGKARNEAVDGYEGLYGLAGGRMTLEDVSQRPHGNETNCCN
jgi:hypothetical protein